MGDLENIDRPRVDRHFLRLRVSGEQHREPAPAGEQNDGLGVGISASQPLVEQLWRWPENTEPQASSADSVAGRNSDRAGTNSLGLIAQAATETRVEQPANRKMSLEQFLDAAGMVGLFVGDDRDTEGIDAGVP